MTWLRGILNVKRRGQEVQLKMGACPRGTIQRKDVA